MLEPGNREVREDRELKANSGVTAGSEVAGSRDADGNKEIAGIREAAGSGETAGDREVRIEPGKTPGESVVEMTELVLPNDTNPLGNLHGGRLMQWIDIAGAIAASRHSNKVVATVALDSLDFRHPVRVGELVILKAKLTWTGNTSMEVTVNVYAENVKNGNIIQTNQAFVTYIALNDEGKPTPVPRLIPETEEEKKDYIEAELRRVQRLKRRNETCQEIIS
jgi:acyl-CoA hydrolase